MTSDGLGMAIPLRFLLFDEWRNRGMAIYYSLRIKGSRKKESIRGPRGISRNGEQAWLAQSIIMFNLLLNKTLEGQAVSKFFI